MDDIKYYETISLESIKNIVRSNIQTVSMSFNAIGYYLKNVRDRNLHKEAGYSSILDFAHAEFGIDPSWANRWMNINDRFSVDGNSPILLEQYKEFGSSLLAEMLTLTDKQIEQVTLTTTRAEIREMKKPEVVAPAQVELDCYDKLAAYWCKRTMTVELYELAKSQNDEDIDVFNQYFNEKYMRSECYAPAYDNAPGYEISFKTNKNGIYFDDEEKTVYSWQLLIDLVCQEAENDTPASKPINFHENDNGLKRLREIRREIKVKSKEAKAEKTIPGQVEPEISNQEEIQRSVTESPDIVTEELENVTEIAEIVTDQDEVESASDQEPEIIEADVIQDDADPEKYSIADIQWEIRDHTNNLDILRKDNTIAPIRYKSKMRLDAANALLDKLREPVVEVEPEVIQPELPILKNNDQRKDWAENYKSWGEWYHDANIDCHYYKYDFPNGDRLIVEEYLDREVYWSDEKRNEKQYHLLIKDKKSYSGKRTYEEKYSHQTTSMSEIIDYLKDFQKKG